jgi:hypothetical protein
MSVAARLLSVGKQGETSAGGVDQDHGMPSSCDAPAPSTVARNSVAMSEFLI